MPLVAVPPTAATTPQWPQPYTPPSPSVYARVWRFLAHRLSPQAPITAPVRSTRRPVSPTPADEMRRRVRMLHELETHSSPAQSPHHEHGSPKNPRNLQATCCNCRQRFFRDLTMAPATTESPLDYCSLDCRSSFEYRAAVQHTIDHQTAFGTADSSRIPTDFSMSTSRL